MEKMLTELCAELNNYFWRSKLEGVFKIEGGTIVVPMLKDGQYFRITGSTLNEGVHMYPASDLKDEEFEGAIWSMAVPQAVVDLASDIDEWQKKYGSIESEAMSPFNSESFGNYSYSKSSGVSAYSGSISNPNSWQVMFSNRLKKWRRLRGMP